MLTILAVVLWPADQPPTTVKDTAPKPETNKPVKVTALINDKPEIPQSQDSPEDLAFDPYEDEAIRAQMMQVADLYEQASRYPHFSQPILNPDQVKEPEPFKETEVDTPFPVEGIDEPIRLLAATDRYQYFAGETISVRLQVLGAPGDTFIQAVAVMSGARGDTPLSAPLNPTNENLTEFQGSFDTGLVPPGILTTEMLLKLQVGVGEQTLFTTVPFRYSDAAAQLVAVPYVRQEAEYLLIPLQYTVYSPGYYFAGAVLEDAESGRPLLQLQAEGPLNQGNGVLTLKAHFQALRAMGSEGPYVLRSIKTYRGAEDGEAYDLPASSAQQRFEIQGFPFEQYDDTAYQDELAAERIEFLRNLGAVENRTEEQQ